MKLMFALFFLAFFGLAPLSAQVIVEANQVILSPRVGPTIEKDEREHYALFSYMEGFDSAKFYQVATGVYYARLFTTSNGRQHDTVIRYSASILSRLAEKVDHLEEMKSGDYQPGSESPTLQRLEPSVPLRIPASEAGEPSDRMAKLVHKEETTHTLSIFPDLLPIRKQGGVVPMHAFYPQFSFGVGLLSYAPDLGEFNTLLTAVENKFRQQGYTISPHRSKLSVPLLWQAHVKFRPFENLALLLEAGRTFGLAGVSTVSGAVEKVSLVSASLFYRPTLANTAWVVPYGGIGIAEVHFSLKEPYGDSFSPAGTSYYYTIDWINAEGGGVGYPVTLGAELHTKTFIEFDVSGSYFFVRDVSTVVEATSAAIKLRSFLFNARLALVL